MTNDPLYLPVSERIYETLSPEAVEWLRANHVVSLAQIVEIADMGRGPTPEVTQELQDLVAQMRRYIKLPATSDEEAETWIEDHPASLPRADREENGAPGDVNADAFVRGEEEADAEGDR